MELAAERGIAPEFGGVEATCGPFGAGFGFGLRSSF